MDSLQPTPPPSFDALPSESPPMAMSSSKTFSSNPYYPAQTLSSVQKPPSPFQVLSSYDENMLPPPPPMESLSSYNQNPPLPPEVPASYDQNPPPPPEASTSFDQNPPMPPSENLSSIDPNLVSSSEIPYYHGIPVPQSEILRSNGRTRNIDSSMDTPTLTSEDNPVTTSTVTIENSSEEINKHEINDKLQITSLIESQKPLLSENGVNAYSGTDKDCSGGEEETSSRRRRRSRWDPPSESDNQNGEANSGSRKRKSRWSEDEPQCAFQLPGFMKDFTGGMDLDPEIQAYNIRLLEINRMLQSGQSLDDRPEGARSPSPEPIYDNMGIRVNTREQRAKDRLNRERTEILSQMIKRNPAFKPPADYRPPKRYKKLYIPMKEYPGYNFIGLIIGPRGNTQKRMEKETGAKIVIRGKGSVKEGRLQQKRDLKPDFSENEDLHVLVEAETQEAVDAAAGMVQKLLQPVDEGLNEHKRQQLRELAALNGTIRDEEFCRLCGEPGHRQFACPARTSTFKSDVLCKICGDGGHPTIDCPMKGTTGKKMDDEYQNFLAELGGTGPDSLTRQNPALPILGSNSSGSNPPWATSNSAGSVGNIPGLTTNGATGKEYDDTNLYIGYLPPTFDDDGLIQLFSPFGVITMAKVIKDRLTGLSKGYGFVKYSDVAQANQAIASMNGYRLEGRMIAVRVAGKPPQPVIPPGPPAPSMPTYPSSGQASGGYPSQHFTQGAPIGNAPPGSYAGGAPVPWGPPVPPPYSPYTPPPPGSSMYTPTQGQAMPPYGVQYPSSIQIVPPGAPSHSVPSGESQQNFPPGTQSKTSSSVQSVPTSAYGNSSPMMPPNVQSTYPPAYSSYYAVAPSVSHSTVDHAQGMGNAPWAPNPPAHPPVSSADQGAYGAESEYEKFMAEMK